MPIDSIRVCFDEKRIDALCAELDQAHLPGAAVGIAVEGRPLYRKGFGLASMELPVVLASSTRMRIASITKQFTCLAYLLLCEEGRAGIDDRIGQHLPELHPCMHAITMHELMTHVGGLRDAHDISYQFSGTGQPVSGGDLLALYRSVDDVNTPPGTAWNYNNGGYLILTTVIERITGRTFDDVLRERIFAPIGMHDTTLHRWDTDFLPNSAALHMSRADGGFEKSGLGTELTGEGGIVSTVDDMLRWLAHMDAVRVGTPATWQRMKAPRMLTNGTSTGYGLGLTIDRYRGVDTLSHSGSLMGCNSHMVKVPAARLDVVVLVNRHDVASVLLANRILDECVAGLEPVRRRACVPPVSGVFRSSTTERVIELYAKGDEQIATIDGFDYPIEPDDDGTLRPVSWLGFFKYTLALTGDRSRPTAIRFSDFGTIDELEAVAPAHHNSVSPIAGRYRSDATDTEAAISLAHDEPRLVFRGRFGSAHHRLRCLTEGVWRAKSTSMMPWGGILSFHRDGSAFSFSSMRTKALRFRRIA